MKISVQSSTYPLGYIKPVEKPDRQTAKRQVKAYNRWQRSLQREIDKILGTDKASKYFI